MNFSSKLLQDAVDEISRLPGIGKNTATRLALNLIKEKDENVLKLIAAIKSLKNGILFCEQCCNLSDKPICGICSNDKRDSSILCIVEDIRDVMAIENTGQFNGLYHVLGGKISPVDGVGPNQLTIDKLMDRVKKNNINEIIFALSATMEGDTTNYYIFKKINDYSIKFSTISRGVSVGDDGFDKYNKRYLKFLQIQSRRVRLMELPGNVYREPRLGDTTRRNNQCAW